jgi:hypothetical protein
MGATLQFRLQDVSTELTMRGLSDERQAELAASLAEPFRQPDAPQPQQQQGQQQHGQQQRQQQQRQQQQQNPDTVTGVSEPSSADPSVHDSERSFELNPRRFDPESGSVPDPDPHVGSPRGGPVKHDSPSEVNRDEDQPDMDSTLQGSMLATR